MRRNHHVIVIGALPFVVMLATSAEAALALAAAATAGAAGWSLRCVRRHTGRQAQGGAASFAALRTISLASASLRAGLTEESARKAARHLRVLLGVPAIAVTDG